MGFSLLDEFFRHALTYGQELSAYTPTPSGSPPAGDPSPPVISGAQLVLFTITTVDGKTFTKTADGHYTRYDEALDRNVPATEGEIARYRLREIPDGNPSNGGSPDGGTHQKDIAITSPDGSVVILDFVYGEQGNDLISAKGFLLGFGGDDTLLGSSGTDYLVGGTGNNVLHGGGGADLLDGTGGWGVADYHDAATAVTVNLDGSANGGDQAEGDRFINVNGVQGSHFADALNGNEVDNWMIGGGGNDTISGGSGNDTLYGSEGDDQLSGGAGNDHLVGGAGSNVLEGGAGADTLDGSDGWGVADYRNAATAVTVRLDGSGNAGDQAAGDRYVNINGVLGSHFGDTLVGNAGANWIIACEGNDLVQGAAGSDTLYGSEGDDSLDGGAGDDLLFGGVGRDVLTGGAGRDVFAFDSVAAGRMDRIVDFSVAEDRIQLDRSVFGGFGSSVKLTMGSMAGGGSAEVIYNGGTGELSYDADGLGGGAAIKFAVLTPGLALQASHFFLV